MKQLFRTISYVWLLFAVLTFAACNDQRNAGENEQKEELSANENEKSDSVMKQDEISILAATAQCGCDEDCFVQYCDTLSLDCLKKILACHYITEETFDFMKEQYTGAQITTSYTVGEVLEKIDTFTCSEAYIEFKEENGKINLSPVKQKRGDLKGKYSVAFFKGLIQVYKAGNSDTIRLTKVGSPRGGITVNLELYRAGSTTPAYRSDLSELYP